MKLLYRYLRREVILFAGVGLLLFTFVLFMQDLGRALEATVGAGAWVILQLFADVAPAALVFTLPVAVLVGVLIGLGRLGVDGELTAMRAAGISGRRLALPLLQVAGAALVFGLLLTLGLAPAALRQLSALTASQASAQAAAQIQPRVFFEPDNNPNWVVYIGGTTQGGRVWQQTLVANMKDQSAPELTMAAQGELVERGPQKIQLHLVNGAQYKLASDHPENSLVSSFRSIDIPFLLPATAAASSSLAALPLAQLWRRARFAADWRAARVEYYRRWALAFACFALALLGIPLGLRGGRGGKSGGFVLTLMLVFGYYLLFILGLGLARQGRLPPFWGVWGANLVFCVVGAWSLWRLERLPHRPVEGLDPVAWVRAALSRRRVSPRLDRAGMMSHWTPKLLEGYISREFLGYSGLLLVTFLVLVLVFTLFELIGSILQNHIAPTVVLRYLLYFTPQMFYMMAPVAILMGVLITFGLMSKANEVTALKASGVSAYRLLIPVLVAACALCAIQFGLDATWLPGFNQKQDELHAQIKGQPAQTFRNPEHKWVFGQANDIFYFSFFDPGRAEFAGISVFEFSPANFQLTRRIFAKSARWDDSIHSWVFTNGWERVFGPTQNSFQRFQVASFGRLQETPGYFATDARQGSQMTYRELQAYIHTLQASGYDVARLSIALWKKLSYPLITVVMALLAFPFALSVGRRGTVAGVTVGIVVAIAYWSSASLLEALGNLNQLPAVLAAWTPDVLFLGIGVYLLLRMPT